MLTKEGDKIDDLANLSKADWSNLRDWECASLLLWWAVLTKNAQRRSRTSTFCAGTCSSPRVLH